MVDLTSLNDGLALFKSGMDACRTAIGVIRDFRNVLPDGSKGEEFTLALAKAERQIQIAEAQIAKGSGYTLCECEFPPTPMLTVGWINQRGSPRNAGRPVRRCPKCGINDAGGWGWSPTASV
jgi:hypothetical protein